MKLNARARAIPDYVDTLDGFRAVATFLVLIFHYWQQSWVSMVVHIGPVAIDFTPIVSIGSLGVELLFALSGFCLYYPLAVHPERRLHGGQYAYKRAVRILPTYFLCVIVCSVYQIGRLDPALLREQFIGNMTLTQMSTASLAYNHLNPVLWSIAIEAQFYLIFPLLLPLFRKKPYWVMLAAFAIGEGWRMYLRDVDYSRIGWLMNQLPAMIDVYVGGMLAAHVAAQLKRMLDERQRAALRPAFTLAAMMFAATYFLAVMYIGALRYEDVPENLSRLQMHTRKFVAVAFCGAIAASVFSCAWMHRLLGNPGDALRQHDLLSGLHVARLDLAAPQGMEPAALRHRAPDGRSRVALALHAAVHRAEPRHRHPHDLSGRAAHFQILPRPRAALGKAQAARIPPGNAPTDHGGTPS